MRLAAIALVAFVLFGAGADAGPKKRPPPPALRPTPGPVVSKDDAEIAKLEKELRELQMKQAGFAAAKVARKVYEARKKAHGEDDPMTVSAKQQLAGAVMVTGDYAGAGELYKEMLANAEKQHGPDSKEVLWALGPVTSTLWAQNKLDEVEPYIQRQLAITKKTDGEKSQSYAQELSSYATLLNMRNEYSSAQRVYEQSLALQESLAKDKHDMLLLGPVQMLAALYWQTNQRPKAIAMYVRAIDIATNAPQATVITKASTMWGVAAMYHYGGRDDLAKPLTQKVIDEYTKEIARLEKDKPDDPMLSAMLGQLGFNYRQIDDLANAEKALEKAIKIDEKRAGFSGSGDRMPM